MIRYAIAFLVAFIVWASPAGAQNPPTNYTTQTTPYDGTESWYCERVSSTNNGRCTAQDLANSVQSLDAGAMTMSTPADPTQTSSATAVMMGLAGTITPTRSGRVLVTVYGVVQNDTNGGQCAIRIRTGTGTAPTNGAALTGTAYGIQQTVTDPTANQPLAYSMTVAVTGLTLGVARWIDVSLGSNGTVICSLFSNTITAGEL